MSVPPADNLKNARGTDSPKQRAAQLPVASNALLTVLKLIVVALTGSVSVLAETINSAGDLLGSSVAYGTVRAAEIPPDESHAYGHGKFENLSGVLIGILIIGGAAYAFGEGLLHLIQHTLVYQTTPAIIVMTFSAVVNTFVSRRLLAIGKKLDSPALTADGKHLRTDIVTSCAALLSLIITRYTKIYWVDPATALLIALLVCWIGVQIARDAVMLLSDISLPASEEQTLRTVLESDPSVLGYHKLRTRKAGSHRHVDVHVQIDDRHSFVEAHQFTEELEDRLRASLPNLHPIIHIEPYEEETKHQQEEEQKSAIEPSDMPNR